MGSRKKTFKTMMTMTLIMMIMKKKTKTGVLDAPVEDAIIV
jgi:hypothetical protein